MLKLALLAVLGYTGYKYYQRNQADSATGHADRDAIAGGPLSDDAKLRRTAPAAK